MDLLSTARGRAIVYTSLYFSEGAPIGFVWWAMPTMLRVRGVPVEEITALTALVLLPWIFKFVWAPLIDLLRTPRWSTKSWIVGAQALMGASLIPLLWIDPVEDFPAFRFLLLAHGFAAATQDAAIDRLAITTVPDGERGRINGYMQGGMLTARSLFGGVSLVVADSIGWSAVIGAMIACILLSILLAAFLRREGDPPKSTLSSRFDEFLLQWRNAVRLRTTWAGLLFALVAAVGFEAAGSLAGPFLVDSGYSQATVGGFFALPVIVATVCGGLLGGWMTDRFGSVKTLGSGLIGFSIPILALGVMGLGGAPYPVSPFVLLTALYFFIGLFVAASYALFMDLTHPGLGSTQFSTYMSATNACESWATWAGGRLTGPVGYGGAFILMTLISLASLAILPFLRKAPGPSR